MDMFPVRRNKVLLQGYLGADAKLHPTEEGTFFNFRLATTEQVKTADGSKEVTEWHNCSLWVKSPLLRSYYEEHLVKGAGVDVEGKIAYEKFVDGKGQEVTSTVIKAGAVQVLSKPQKESEEKPEPTPTFVSPPVQPRPETSTHAGFSAIPPQGPPAPEF